MNPSSLAITINSQELGSIMFYLILGILFASLYTIFIKNFRGEFILALINAEAFDEGSAKTFSELGIKNSKIRRFLIETKFFFIPDYFTVEPNSEECEVKYYVNPENTAKLEAKYGNSGITIVQLIITIIALFAVALVMATAVPDILNMFNL